MAGYAGNALINSQNIYVKGHNSNKLVTSKLHVSIISITMSFSTMKFRETVLRGSRGDALKCELVV